MLLDCPCQEGASEERAAEEMRGWLRHTVKHEPRNPMREAELLRRIAATKHDVMKAHRKAQRDDH